MDKEPAPLLLSIREAAAVLGVGKTFFYGAVDAGEIPYVQLGTEKRSRRYITREALTEYIESKTEQATQ